MRPNEVTSALGVRNEELTNAFFQNAFIFLDQSFAKQSIPTLLLPTSYLLTIHNTRSGL